MLIYASSPQTCTTSSSPLQTTKGFTNQHWLQALLLSLLTYNEYIKLLLLIFLPKIKHEYTMSLLIDDRVIQENLFKRIYKENSQREDIWNEHSMY